jgi:5-methylcytosine-specific restriction endonuclease McrA
LKPSIEEKRRLRGAVWDRDNGRCRYCGKACEWSGIRVTGILCDDNFGILEHVIPTRKGGTWKIANLVLACVYCNAKKALLNGETISCEHGAIDIERFMRIAGIQL